MGKSSGSLKKKRSKKFSKVKASSKKKSGKYKSKKVSRREVSLSSSDYDDSKSVDPLVSSSSEDSRRRKRDRDRTRKDVKGRKKKVRRRSHSRDSSEDSLYSRKRKKVKRENEYEVRKKPYQKKKKIKREASVSSRSSGSRRTYHGGNASSDDDSENESRRGRSERKEKDKRRLERGRSRNEKSSRYRTRSCSPCSPCGESFDEGTEDKHISENNSRRLRSVITFPIEVEESGESYRNETNEEIVDDHDYPCRSNDSNDGGTKRESDRHILTSSEEKVRVEDEAGDVNDDFTFAEPKTVDRSHNDRNKNQAFSAGTIESMKKGTIETTGANLDSDDLESILRQRALENLKKFRGEVQSTAKASNQKYKIVSQKQPITDKHEPVQGKSIINNIDVGTKLNKQTPVEETSLSVRRRNLIANNERVLNMNKDISSSSKHHLACPPEKVTDADNPSETVTESDNCRTNNPESHHDSLQSHSTLKQTPVSGLPQEQFIVAESSKDRGISGHVVSHSSNDSVNNIIRLSSGAPKPYIRSPKFRHDKLDKGRDEFKEHSQFEPKQTSASNKPPSEKFLVSEGDVGENAPNTTQAAIQSINNSGSDVDESHNSATPKSCIESSSVENNSGNLQDESNQGSQFEQKTMTVMRGGEMVEVSYKVYIPKKAPALARRQLKR